MRARNIKPGFFTNEALSECEPLARILFTGLWCLAAWDGKLEDRPKKIKMSILPYDSCDVDQLLESLHRHGLIHRYKVGDKRYIIIPNFSKHQRPHPDERKRPSGIPDPPVSDQSEAVSRKDEAKKADFPTAHAPENAAHAPEGTRDIAPSHGSRAVRCDPLALNADILNPSSLNPESPLTPRAGGGGKNQEPPKPPPEETAKPSFGLSAGDLGNAWVFYLRAKGKGRGAAKRDDAETAASEFEGLIGLGVPTAEIMAEIELPHGTGPGRRDRWEHLWQLKNRLKSRFGVTDDGRYGRTLGPDSRVHATAGKYDPANLPNYIAAAEYTEDPPPAQDPARTGKDPPGSARGHPRSSAG